MEDPVPVFYKTKFPVIREGRGSLVRELYKTNPCGGFASRGGCGGGRAGPVRDYKTNFGQAEFTATRGGQIGNLPHRGFYKTNPCGGFASRGGFGGGRVGPVRDYKTNFGQAEFTATRGRQIGNLPHRGFYKTNPRGGFASRGGFGGGRAGPVRDYKTNFGQAEFTATRGGQIGNLPHRGFYKTNPCGGFASRGGFGGGRVGPVRDYKTNFGQAEFTATRGRQIGNLPHRGFYKTNPRGGFASRGGFGGGRVGPVRDYKTNFGQAEFTATRGRQIGNLPHRGFYKTNPRGGFASRGGFGSGRAGPVRDYKTNFGRAEDPVPVFYKTNPSGGFASRGGFGGGRAGRVRDYKTKQHDRLVHCDEIRGCRR